MAAVIAILLVVMTAGIGLRTGAPVATQRVAADLVSAMADRARTSAISKRSSVVMAMATPADLPVGADGRCRIGLFQVISESGEASSLVRTVTQLGRWQRLDRSIGWAAGKVDGAVNPFESPRLVLRDGEETLRLHCIIFHSRGGLEWPLGSAPAVIRISQAGALSSGKVVPENRLRVGRINGRSYPSE